MPTGENNLAGLCEPDEITWAVCEGCGAGWFDFTGKWVAMPPGVAGILAITQATVQAAETALFQLVRVAPKPQWLAALYQFDALKKALAEDTEAIEEDDAPPEGAS